MSSNLETESTDSRLETSSKQLELAFRSFRDSLRGEGWLQVSAVMALHRGVLVNAMLTAMHKDRDQALILKGSIDTIDFLLSSKFELYGKKVLGEAPEEDPMQPYMRNERSDA